MNDNENEITFLINKNVIIHNYKNYSKIGNVFYPLKTNTNKIVLKTLIDNFNSCDGFLISNINHFNLLDSLKVSPKNMCYINVLSGDNTIKNLYDKGVRLFVFDNFNSLKKFVSYADLPECKISIRLNTMEVFDDTLMHLGSSTKECKEMLDLIIGKCNNICISFYLQTKIKNEIGALEKMLHYIENNLIRNVMVFKIYIRLSGNSNLKAGSYELSENMNTKEIVNILVDGSKKNPDEISITFKEGKNIRAFANVISEKTNNTYDDVISIMSDSEYIYSLINEYWFLTDDIKNTDIYYPLEGYLYPNTYAFNNKDVGVKDIIEKMLKETDKKLSKYKKDIESNKYSIHEIMTLASVVELEGANANDRKAVAGVFINRLNSSYYPTLGSDATTYYASKIDDWSYSLTYKELNDCSNKYNTRCSSNTGLPIGPICNPSIESIEAVIYPEEHNYYYFVADCKGNVYLSENSTVHNNTINKLKKENNWCA